MSNKNDKELNLEEFLEDGKPRYMVLSNGSIRDNLKRVIVKGSPMTSDQARALAIRKKELHQQAMTEGLAEGLKVRTDDKGQGVLRAIGKKAGEVIDGTKSARGLAELLNFSVEKSGLLPKGTEREERKDEPVKLSVEGARALIDLLDKVEESRRKTVEGRVIN